MQAVQALRHLLLALQFFTRVPVTGRLAEWVGYSPAMLRASVAHFPAIGLLVGGLAVAVFAGLSALLPPNPHSPLVAAVLSTVATVWLTGGFHEDGLADVADGLGGHVSRERALDIMKDSRIGAYGAMALVLVLLTKVALLAALGSVSTRLALLALGLGHVVSRTTPLLTIRLLPHVGDTAASKSKPLADQISGPALAVGFSWFFGALALYWQWFSDIDSGAIAAGLGGAALGWLLMWRLLRRRLQGFTGDGLGATQQLSEAGFLLGALLAAA
jgi:adenosylcobinamide-GDP ribazoletransferase